MWNPLRVIHGRLHISHLKTTFLFSFTLRSSRSVHLDVKTLRICAFRGRSRHTCGFEPLDEFELPRKEFLAAVKADHGDSRICSFKSTPGSENFQWVETDLGDDEMADAASRCILLHGLFEVWGHGHSIEEAADDATRAGRIPQECLQSSWSLSATSFGRSKLTREEEETLTEPVARVLSSELRGRRTDSKICDIGIHVIEDACPPPPAPLFATGAMGLGGGKRGKARPKPKEGEQNGASKSREPWCYVCRLLRLGPATGERLTMGARPRRPKAGILNALALHTRRSRGPTAIEPEIALLMANLAKVQSNSSVLDPFCGHCSLLLPAAKMGARTWGSDVAGPVVSAGERGFHAPGSDSLEPGDTEGSRTAYQADHQDSPVYDESSATHARGLAAIYEDFSAFGLVMPELAMADIADESSPFRIPEFFDAIITDPPYNIKERVLLDQDERPQNTSMSMSMSVSTMFAPTEEDSNSSHLISPPSPRSELSEGLMCDVQSVSGTAASDTSLFWNGQTTSAALALANCLVGAVVLKLVSVARCALKPRGRLVFFLPLRGHEARLESLPQHVSEKLCEENARGQRLSLISATKQRLTSQNMCRWLIVMEKECQ